MGDAAVGKTTFLNRLLTGEFQKKYEPTLGAQVCDLNYSTTKGKINYNCWDIGM